VHAVGAKFAGAHGLGDGGDAHEDADYTVVGVLAPSGTVLDRLVLTSVESVWAVHAQHQGIHDIENAAAQMKDEEKEYTALLVQYASPLAAAILPRYVNNNSEMQAASPAYETARLFSIIGVGTDVLRGFALVLVFSAALSVFIALYNALEERRYDLSDHAHIGRLAVTADGAAARRGYAARRHRRPLRYCAGPFVHRIDRHGDARGSAGYDHRMDLAARGVLCACPGRRRRRTGGTCCRRGGRIERISRERWRGADAPKKSKPVFRHS